MLKQSFTLSVMLQAQLKQLFTLSVMLHAHVETVVYTVSNVAGTD